MPKIVTTVTLTALVALSLVACSSPADASCDATASGSHSSSVKVSGEFGKEPKVTMPAAFDAKETERSVLISGSGAPAEEGDVVTTHYAAYNASTGAAIELSPGSTWSELSIPIDENNSFPGLYKSLVCAHEGDRIVSAIPAADLFGGMNVDMSAQGIGPTDTVVFIFDVSKVGPVPAQSAPPTQEPPTLPTPAVWVENVPTVDLTGEVPVVTLPSTAPPADLELKVLSEGTGETVTAGSSVTVDYQGTSWDTKEIFDQSYTRGEPATFPVSGVIPGFGAAMVGQKVGASLLVTIPPKFAYGSDASAHPLGGQTLVFLIQIRAVS